MRNEVPDKILNKRNWIKYERKIIDISPEVDKKNTSKIIDNIYVETIYNKIHINTLLETKEQKINQLKTLCTEEINNSYPEYKQRNASLDIYGEEFKQEIIIFIQEKRNKINNLISQVNECETIDEVNLIQWH